MKKLISFFLILNGIFFTASADHITGGEMFYSFTGFSGGVYHYNVTLKLFMRCNSGRRFNDPTIISVFDKSTNNRIFDINVPLANKETISLTNFNSCISNPPVICYEVGYFNFQLSVPGSQNGYILASQVNFRIQGINNMVSGYNNIGATYTAEIPGTSSSPENNSAKFTASDLVIVCSENSFSYNFGAVDNDGDLLRYSFCSAYQSGYGGGGSNTVPPPPPYQSIPYGSNFSSSTPLGNNVHIDSNTGLITGIAPSSGTYVVTVCVEEIRNSIVIATQRKDLQINIAPCSIAAATLQREYLLCKNSKSISISNLSLSPLITSTYWELINARGVSIYNSTNSTLTYTFPDTGSYKIKLVINREQQCSDSTSSIARVYPGFVPGFHFSGICFKKPTIFTNATTTVFGVVTSSIWDFGETSTTSDISNVQNPAYTYPSTGAKNITLIAGNSLGCKDTLIKSLMIVEKPPLSLAFRDTLICQNDEVQLSAAGSGNFSWTPPVNITNSNTPAPTVSPVTHMTYFVLLDDNGCRNTDSVKIRVTDHVNLQAMNDTTICQDDALQLHVVSDGFQYSWKPASAFNDPHSSHPVAVANEPITYEVTASIGGCSATDQVVVNTVPFPFADAGPDTTICFKTFGQLRGNMNGTSFSWSPAGTLNNSRVLNPIANPGNTTTYTLTVFDTKGCPKPGIDKVVVKVLPKISAFAGKDTSVVVGQPLQLIATGGVSYSWSPTTGLSAGDLPVTIALFREPDSVRYKVIVLNEAGCADSAFITVKIFNTHPSVFVPNAFTPNGDGKNDVLRPIGVGIKSIENFNVYNRWGQLVFSSTSPRVGWDGRISGKLQETATFVWIVKAIDYSGAVYFKKGTATLIR